MQKNKKAILTAIVVGAVAAAAFYAFSSDILGLAPGAKNREEAPGTVAKVKYVIATVDIQRRTKITAEMLSIVEAPADYPAPGAVSSIERAEGRIATDRILAGEIVLEGNLRSKDAPGELSFALPPGMRAITIGASVTSAVGNMLKAGDRVDVVARLDEQSAGDDVSFTMLRNITVLATDTDIIGAPEPQGPIAAEKKSADKQIEYKSVTLAATPEDCVKLSLVESVGSLKLALHSGEEINAGPGEMKIAALRELVAGATGKAAPVAPAKVAAKPAPAPRAQAKARPAARTEIHVATAPLPAPVIKYEEPPKTTVSIMRGVKIETIEFSEEEEMRQ